MTEPTDTGSIFRAAAAQLAPMVEAWQWLLAEHGRTPSGHCSAAACGRPG